jgi:hypothetical protein
VNKLALSPIPEFGRLDGTLSDIVVTRQVVNHWDVLHLRRRRNRVSARPAAVRHPEPRQFADIRVPAVGKHVWDTDGRNLVARHTTKRILRIWKPL